ncbi:hypothetical protein RS9916_36822 [Synechococcus sp. RS9916]|nr:hypothetical protein RS9916_36822 [Synechococcus sp. RS9916]
MGARLFLVPLKNLAERDLRAFIHGMEQSGNGLAAMLKAHKKKNMQELQSQYRKMATESQSARMDLTAAEKPTKAGSEFTTKVAAHGR